MAVGTGAGPPGPRSCLIEPDQDDSYKPSVGLLGGFLLLFRRPFLLQRFGRLFLPFLFDFVALTHWSPPFRIETIVPNPRSLCNNSAAG